jgi:hypothetical protein
MIKGVPRAAVDRCRMSRANYAERSASVGSGASTLVIWLV